MKLIKRINLTYEEILQRTNEYSIFSYYVGHFTVGGVMRSVFRRDKSPSFSIRRNKENNLYFIDYGDDRFKGNCVQFVMMRFGLDYNTALTKIDYDLNLNIRSLKVNAKPLKIIPPLTDDTPKEITIIKKPYTEKELHYWQQYDITLAELEKERVYSVKKYFVNGHEGLILPQELCFCYYYEQGKKLYFPEREKGKRWKSSIPNTLIEGWDDITDLSRCIISKSKKDRLVLNGVIKNVISTQNESTAAFTAETLETLSHFREVIVFYDNDKAGIKAAEQINKLYGYKVLYLPQEQNITDPAEYYHKHGKQKLKTFIHENITGKVCN